MDIMLWVVFGGIVDWLASFFRHAHGRQAMILNIAIVLLGTLVGAFLLGPVLRGGTGVPGDASLLVSFLSALQ